MRTARLELFLLAVVVSALALQACAARDSATRQRVEHPDTPTVDHVDVYHGVEVADPYRWLEQDVRKSERVRRWVDAQNEVTFAHLAEIPQRQAILDRLKMLWDFEKYSLPVDEGGRHFYEYNDGLQNQDVLLVQENLAAEPELLIDPNAWSEDGTVALASYYPSPDGRFLAYTVQDGGSDWRLARVIDLSSRQDLADELKWLKFTPLAWLPDGSGFFYTRYPAPESGTEFQATNENASVYFHRVGTRQAEDRVTYARPDHPDWGFTPTVTEDGRYLVLTVWIGTDDRYQIVYQDLKEPRSDPKTLIEGFDHDYTLVGNLASQLVFRTNIGAPNGKLIAIDVERPEPEHWAEIVPESEHVLVDVSLVGGHFLAEYLRDACSEVIVFTLEGKPVRTVELPGPGSAFGFEGKADAEETFYSYSSFNSPPTIYRYEVATGSGSVFKQAEVDFEPHDYNVEQLFYQSKDGTRVPMFLSYRRGVESDGDRPTLLYGYGGFNVSMRPAFSISRLAWMELGGIYAVANLRGGGEYGESWHEAGTKLNKQNVFDDFIAAAEHLIAEGYTRPARLAIFGGSNGGLLVGAATNQRPDLFGAAIPAVGVMDMLRFHRFTAGRLWVDDYGSADDPEQFRALYAYSPYHNIRKGTSYPAILALTADTDDRVVPSHSFKYIAALQAAQAGDAPVLIRIETRAGHGAGTPTDKIIQEYADCWAFLVEHLDIDLPQGSG